MAFQVVNGAMLKCSFGTASAALVVAPANKVNCVSQPAATIMDFAPVKNIPPFGMCITPANPAVAAATAAKMGTLTPVPCVPNTVAPWTPGAPTVAISQLKVMDSACICTCLWTGVITVAQAGQTSVLVP